MELRFAVPAALVGLAFEQILRRVVRGDRESPPWLRRLPEKLPLVLVCLLFAFFAAYFGFHTVQQHYNLHTYSYDLAIFDNMLWNLTRGEWFTATPAMGPTGSHIRRHATFLAYLFVPFYALRQKADFLLVAQAVVVGAGVFPLFLFVRRLLGNAWVALAFAYAYVVYTPVHGPVFYDFHYLTLAPFFVFWVFYCFETDRTVGLAVAVALALLLREDIGAGLALGFVFFMLSGRRRAVAGVGALGAALYFVLVKFVVMPLHAAGASGPSFLWLYKDLIPPGHSAVGGILHTVITRPIYTLGTLATEEKLLYVIELLAPLLFLACRHSRTWVMLLVPAALTVLTTGWQPTVQTSFQYTAYWTPYLFAGAAYVMAGWRSRPDGRRRVFAACIAMLVTSTAFTYHHGAIFQSRNFRGGFRRVQFGSTETERQNRRDLYFLIEQIPRNASVAATESEAPHVSNRRNCFTMRYGYHNADYLLLAVREASRGMSKKPTRRALRSGKYGLVETRGSYMLWGRGHDRSRNAKGYKMLGWRR